MTKAIKFREDIAEVIGIGVGKKEVKFSLSAQEIKHIRRTIIHYDRIFLRAYQDKNINNLSWSLFSKFMKFGRIKRRMGGKTKKIKIKSMKQACNYQGCKETEKLTLDHIKRLNNEENPNIQENLQLLCPKHHLLKELEAHLFHKEIEIKKIKERIEDIEKNGTTDCLGYKVLSKNKFISPDEDEI